MTNPYAMGAYQQTPNVYQFQQNPAINQPQFYPQEDLYDDMTYAQQRRSSGPSTLGMMTLGALGGGTVGYFRKRYPVSKDGVVSEKFANDVFEKNLKKNCSGESKTYFKQIKNVLKKIDKVKSPESFKKLVITNKELLDSQCRGINADTFLSTVNSTNLKNSKESLRDTLNAIMNFEKTKTKNAIRMAWDPEKKKFIKTDEFKDDKLFKIIKNTKNGSQFKKALKYGGITAGILGILTIGYKIFTTPKD